MTKETFAQLAQERLIFLDGATGTNLYKKGMPKGVCTEQWILGNPQVMQQLQRDYAEAGSDIVYAPTFGANRESLKKFGLEDKTADMNKALVELSQKAVEGRAMVAGDMSPTGLLLESSGGEAGVDEIFEIYREQAQALYDSGVELISVETMMSVDETTIALDAVSSVCNLPVMCSLYVNADGRAYYGGSVYDAAEVLQEMGACAVGINCCNGPDQLEAIVRSIAQVVSIPVLAKPNAGLPHIDEAGNAVYDMGADEFAKHMKALINAGAGVVGGCCGTDPSYIRKLKAMTEGKLILP